MTCGFPYCGGIDCADCHKPKVPVKPLEILRELVEATDAYMAALPTRNWDLHDPVKAKEEQDRIDAASNRKRAAWGAARAAASMQPSGEPKA